MAMMSSWPVEVPSAGVSEAAWSAPRPPFSFRIFTEKRAGGGEDAEPLLVPAGERIYMGVLDGMGGAGAARFPDPDDPERMLSGAYLSVRALRAALVSMLTDPAEIVHGLCASRPRLEAQILAALQGLQSEHGSQSRVKSKTLKKDFPTTVALASVEPASGGHCHVEVLWAGDSRVYALVPEEGLLQLTRDHVMGGADAFTNVLADSQLERSISLADVRLDEWSVDLPADAALLAATDGCFDYLSSPMEFEEMLLTTMLDADSVEGWRDGLQQSILAVTADDATAVLYVPSCDTLEELQARFGPRHRMLREQLGGTERSNRAALARLWDEYRDRYESRLPVVGDLARPPTDTQGEGTGHAQVEDR